MPYRALLTDRKGFQKTLELPGNYPDHILEIPVFTQSLSSIDDSGIPDRAEYRVIRFGLVKIEEGEPQALYAGVPRRMVARVLSHFTAYYEEVEEAPPWDPPDPPRQKRFIDTRKLS